MSGVGTDPAILEREGGRFLEKAGLKEFPN